MQVVRNWVVAVLRGFINHLSNRRWTEYCFMKPSEEHPTSGTFCYYWMRKTLVITWVNLAQLFTYPFPASFKFFCQHVLRKARITFLFYCFSTHHVAQSCGLYKSLLGVLWYLKCLFIFRKYVFKNPVTEAKGPVFLNIFINSLLCIGSVQILTCQPQTFIMVNRGKHKLASR